MLDIIEVNNLIRDKMQTGEVAGLYKAIALNQHLEIGDSLKLGAEYSINTECDTYEGWNSRGYRILRGEHSNMDVKQRKNKENYLVKYFSIEQTTAAGKKHNTRTSENVFEAINQYAFMQVFAEKIDFNAIVAAVRNYAAENNIIFNPEYEPVIATGIASIIAYTCNDSSKLEIKPIPFPSERSYLENAQILKEIHSSSKELLSLIEIAEERKKTRATSTKTQDKNEETENSFVQTSLFDAKTEVEKTEEKAEPQNEVRLSPVYENYLKLQAKYNNAIIAYRLGDFYEILGENATKAAEILNITLTSREVGLQDRIPMCGFPFYIADIYTSKLTENGYDVVKATPLDYNNSSSELLEETVIPAITSESAEEKTEIITAEEKSEIVSSTELELDTEEDDDVFEEEQRLTFGGAKTRYEDNLAAIKLLRELQGTGRAATPEEKKILKKYVGWGGISEVFDERKENWQTERNELRKYLNATEYDSAAASTTDAFYTPYTVIKSIYNALEHLGVKGGNRILEPSMGVGNFFRVMPKEIKEDSELNGVEIDTVTGELAKQIYPEAKINVKGFEKVLYPNNYFDVVIGNVPFGNSKPVDIEKDYNFNLHNFIIAKSIDKTRPGGIIALITTSSTMDEWDRDARKWMADRAELLGAIRLPYDTFKANANTTVGTDILFLQKREEIIDSSDNWSYNTKSCYDEYGNFKYYINNYFYDNPEMVIGDYTQVSARYGKTYKPVLKEGESLKEKLSEAIQHLPQNVFTPISHKEKIEQETSIPADISVKNLNYKIIDEKLYQRQGDVMIEKEITGRTSNALERIAAMIELRDNTTKILAMQRNNCSDEELLKEQAILNEKYDNFVKKYGTLHSKINKKLFEDDGEAAILYGLENVDTKTKEISKAQIFTKRTIRPEIKLSHIDNAIEALQICKNEKGKVDIKFIENLTGKDFETVISELKGIIFKNPDYENKYNKYEGYESSEIYLSGDVKDKLNKARTAAQDNSEYAENVTALEKVQPLPIPAEDIIVNLGATWIDEKFYEQFIKTRILDMEDNPYSYEKISVHYSDIAQGYVVDANLFKSALSERNTSTYGTEYISALELFTQAINLKTPNIYDSSIDGDGKTIRVFNAKKTALARQKQQLIKEEFNKWIFEDYNRREYLTEKYNNIFNRYRLPEYDGSHLTFPGMNPDITLLPHQKNAIYRGIADGTVLLHHSVGAGKTFEMDALIMKLKQSGLAHKPLQVVPKSLLEQSEQEFRKLYPAAKLLVAHPEDLRTERRKEFVAKVALGDWDCIIMAMSQFEEIKVSPERQAKKLADEINKITDSLKSVTRDKKNSDGLSVKKINGILKRKRAELERLMKNNDKPDDTIKFEDLGIDYLFIDEAHNYKNKYFYTKMSNVAGIGTAASQKASMLDLKIDYLNEIHNGDKGVIFATGTPISNSMSEMYTMQSYLQKSRLKKLGLDAFDNWAATFGEIVNSLEIKVTGDGYRTRKRFASFVNVPELMTMYGLFADVKTTKELKLPTPTPHYEKMIVQSNALVQELMQEISKRAEKINAGGVDPAIDNMLKITSDGKKIALDARLFDNSLPETEGGKLQVCAEKIAEIYHNTEEQHKTQIVFCDSSTPKSGMSLETYDSQKEFNVYYEMERKLIDLGVKKEEIAFIHDYENEEAKKRLFDEVNSGKIRVLFGSTTKCGVGMNVQRKLVALHHLDIPYRPADMEQREGRIIRQGNENSDVTIYTYAQEGTFDVYLFQILETKQKFIQQLLDFKLQNRKIEDIADTSTLSYSEMKAAISGDTRIIELEQLRQKEAALRLIENEYRKNLYRLETKINQTYPKDLQHYKQQIDNYEKDIEVSKNNEIETFTIEINGKIYQERNQETAEAFAEAFNNAGNSKPFAKYRGFELTKAAQLYFGEAPKINILGANTYTLTLGESKTGNLTRLENAINNLDSHRIETITSYNQTLKDLEEAKKQKEMPFSSAQELEEIVTRLTQLKLELGINDTQTDDVIVDTDADEVDTEINDENHYRRIPLEFMDKEDIYKEIITSFKSEDIEQALKSREQNKEIVTTKGIDYKNLNSYSTEDINAALENKYKFITAAGYEVLDLKQDHNRTNAIIQRTHSDVPGKKDYIIGLNYDVKTGEWGQGRYDFQSMSEAENYYNINIAKSDKQLEEKYTYHTAENFEVLQLEKIDGEEIALCRKLPEANANGNESYIIYFGYNSQNGEYKAESETYSNYNDIVREYEIYFSELARTQVPFAPDNITTIKNLQDYGYWWNGMLPINSPERAEQLYEQGFEIFALHSDNTESHINNIKEIREDYNSFAPYFGIEKSAWISYLNSENAPKELYAELRAKQAAIAIAETPHADTLMTSIMPAYKADVIALDRYFESISYHFENGQEMQDYFDKAIERTAQELSGDNSSRKNELKEQLKLFDRKLNPSNKNYDSEIKLFEGSEAKATYYYVWATHKNLATTSYYVDYYSKNQKGTIDRKMEFYGEISRQELQKRIEERQGKSNYIEISENTVHELDKIREHDFKISQVEQKMQELAKAQAEPHYLDEETLARLYAENKASFIAGDITAEEYELENTILRIRTAPIEKTAMDNTQTQNKKWHTIILPTNAAKIKNDKTYKISMSNDGIYAGADFWVSKKFIKDETKESFKLILPINYTVRMSTPNGELSVSADKVIADLQKYKSEKAHEQTEEIKEPIQTKDSIMLDSNNDTLKDLNLSDVRKELLSKLMSAMENGSYEWMRTWATTLPKNAVSGKPYNGVNNLLLSLISEERGYKDSRWLTFNQIKSHNWKLKKGSKAAQVELVKFMDKSTHKEFDVSSVEGMTEEEKSKYWAENVRMLFKSYSVFNASCVDGIPEEKIKKLSQTEQNESCEKIIANSPAKIYFDGGNSAYYRPSTDSIHLPARERFISQTDFYLTALHEIGHSSGHSSRLNRDLTGMQGSENYAKEELCAEFGSIFIAQTLGIDISERQINSSAAYLKSWAKVIKQDPKYLFKAITEAGKIENYVVNLQNGAEPTIKAVDERNTIELMQRGGEKKVSKSKFILNNGIKNSIKNSDRKHSAGNSMTME